MDRSRASVDIDPHSQRNRMSAIPRYALSLPHGVCLSLTMVATKPVEFRKGHDGLAALVKNVLLKDPFTGTVFVFRSRKAAQPYWSRSR